LSITVQQNWLKTDDFKLAWRPIQWLQAEMSRIFCIALQRVKGDAKRAAMIGSPPLPLRVREIVEVWKGKGWGFRFERKRTEVITEIDKERKYARD